MIIGTFVDVDISTLYIGPMLALFHLVLQHRQHLHDGLHQVTELWPVRGVKLPAVPHHCIPVDVISHYRPLQLLSLHHIISAFCGQKVCSLIFAPRGLYDKTVTLKKFITGCAIHWSQGSENRYTYSGSGQNGGWGIRLFFLMYLRTSQLSTSG